MGLYPDQINAGIVRMILAVGLVSCKDIFPGTGSGPTAEYEVTIENVSESYTILKSDAFAVYHEGNPIFDEGKPATGNGPEEGMFDKLVSSLSSDGNVSERGGFNQPAGANGPGSLLPGEQYKFRFTAAQGDRLTFATMYIQSNDLFCSSTEQGVTLFSAANRISGDITDQILLWDAGTEVNEKPGGGGHQVLRQTGLGTGTQEGNPNVYLVNDQYNKGMSPIE
ncbi:spondin domain-containing protein [Fodinibius sediminis]|uniref:Spondin_N n=1 Tax=Fodinibius sediminis TaxID=1214077 RepID=A0A521E5Z3_9BACT|nr:spondin domain-containing protein [Fodinibius sediminis]SMO79358.1 hypothetical protein SAMN06265218_113127 [Fodinibius sediminis]